jgi:nucleoside-diphosphate-sugar epimerase
MKQKVLVTGANGFVGRAVCQHLLDSGFGVQKALRKIPEEQAPENISLVGEIDAHTDWAQALVGIDSIVHLAARVHVMNDSATDPLLEFRKVNVKGTANLAEQAALLRLMAKKPKEEILRKAMSLPRKTPMESVNLKRNKNYCRLRAGQGWKS